MLAPEGTKANRLKWIPKPRLPSLSACAIGVLTTTSRTIRCSVTAAAPWVLKVVVSPVLMSSKRPGRRAGISR